MTALTRRSIPSIRRTHTLKSVQVTGTDPTAMMVPPPDFAGFVKVEPTGTIEFLVNLAKK